MVNSLLGYYNESEDRPLSTCRQSEQVAKRQESPAESRFPLPDQSLTSESPAHAPPRKDNQLVLPASPSSDVVYSPKLQVAASPERSPTPELLYIPVNATTSFNPSKISSMTTARYLWFSPPSRYALYPSCHRLDLSAHS
ncbi:hypothetical protein AZE42_06729 [Rhizopogon vesiculosus]|uniref:Uncharacterized protein n=1 Tax=Rhizopogon vesiculosus TaxID=180088 RepID=A0A1J8PZ74_9AGAM|nr:hypothetical protein AZE42_06729 [Rhizopogon vesiculosus]